MMTKEKPLIVVTTGGSGGHIFPAEAISEALIKQGARVVFMTDKRGSAFQGLAGVKVYRLAAESVTGRSFFGKVKAAVKLYIGTAEAIFLLAKLKPAAVLGVGGYASIPGVMAAHLMRIPVILHEQNAVLGRANRLLARGTRLIGTSFPQTLRVPSNIPQIQVGLPVRSAVMKEKGAPYVAPKSVFHLLIFGGSQGARFFSNQVCEALLKIPVQKRAQIDLVQQVRAEDMAHVESCYQKAGFKKVVLKSFFDDMPEQLKKAHLVIGRGGAGTLTELMVVGRPAMIIPLPTAADNHQVENARQFCDKGAGWLVLESGFNAQLFADRISRMIDDGDMLAEAARRAQKQAPDNAAQKMAGAVLDVVKGVGK